MGSSKRSTVPKTGFSFSSTRYSAPPRTLFVSRGILFKIPFRANLCLWTNRSGNVGDVAERSYGVLRSYKWDMLGVWSIDAANNITVVTPMSIPISLGAALRKTRSLSRRTRPVRSGPPTALSLVRHDGKPLTRFSGTKWGLEQSPLRWPSG